MRTEVGPQVSVLIPMHNAAPYIGEALESVLTQMVEIPEIVVVDDGSTDDSAEVVARFGAHVRYIGQARGGIAAARNAAMRHATGTWFAHLDADDRWPAASLESRLAALAADPSLEGVIGRFLSFVSPELEPEERARLHVPTDVRHGHVAGCALLHRDLFARVGPLNESLAAGADLDWLVRAGEAGARLGRIDEIVLHRRLHRTNWSRTAREVANASRLRILKGVLDRRRREE